MNFTSHDPLVAALEERIRAAVEARVAELARPALVHQRTVEAVVGLPASDYLRLARAGAFPVTRERRLVVARTADVVAVYEQRMVIRQDVAANDTDGALDQALARVGGRRVSRP